MKKRAKHQPLYRRVTVRTEETFTEPIEDDLELEEELDLDPDATIPEDESCDDSEDDDH